MRKSFLLCAVVLLQASASFGGSYGTIQTSTYGINGMFQQGSGGRFDWTVTNDSSSFPAPLSADISLRYPDQAMTATGNRLFTYCIELAQNLQAANAPLVWDLEPVTALSLPAPQALQLEILVDNYYQTAIRDNGGTFTQEEDEAGGFQLAVWDVILGNGSSAEISPYSGTYSAAAFNIAAMLLNESGAQGSWVDDPNRSTVLMLSADAQDQLFQIAVPEASSLLAFASVAGAIGLIVSRRRK